MWKINIDYSCKSKKKESIPVASDSTIKTSRLGRIKITFTHVNSFLRKVTNKKFTVF